MKELDIDAILGVYILSLVYPNGTVDIIDDCNQMVFRKIPPSKAVQICELHHELRRKVHKILEDV